MPQHVPLTPKGLVAELRALGLSVKDLAFYTRTSETWCARVVRGRKPIPHWLNLLMIYWKASPASLQIARETAEAMQVQSTPVENVTESQAA